MYSFSSDAHGGLFSSCRETACRPCGIFIVQAIRLTILWLFSLCRNRLDDSVAFLILQRIGLSILFLVCYLLVGMAV
jgi:hypothetical protein